jgi:hypothetical protein
MTRSSVVSIAFAATEIGRATGCAGIAAGTGVDRAWGTISAAGAISSMVALVGELGCVVLGWIVANIAGNGLKWRTGV